MVASRPENGSPAESAVVPAGLDFASLWTDAGTAPELSAGSEAPAADAAGASARTAMTKATVNGTREQTLFLLTWYVLLSETEIPHRSRTLPWSRRAG